MKKRLRERWNAEAEQFRKIGWRGIFVGFLLSVLVAPVLSPLITPVYVSAGIYSEPQLEASVEQIDSVYSPGDRAGKYGNVTWEKGYSVYRVQFHHTGGPSVERAVFEVRFPGCVEQSSGFGEGNGEITVNNPLRAEVYTSNRTGAEVVGCTVQVSTESIHPNEGYTLEFVVDHTPERCNLLTGYNPNKRFLVEYHWSKNGAPITDRVTGQIQGADRELQAVRLPTNSTKLIEKRGYKAYIVGVGNGDEKEAMSSCFG